MRQKPTKGKSNNNAKTMISKNGWSSNLRSSEKKKKMKHKLARTQVSSVFLLLLERPQPPKSLLWNRWVCVNQSPCPCLISPNISETVWILHHRSKRISVTKIWYDYLLWTKCLEWMTGYWRHASHSSTKSIGWPPKMKKFWPNFSKKEFERLMITSPIAKTSIPRKF